jgi:CO dehydrogenase/acetyl-CoA synthase epsilon subunit
MISLLILIIVIGGVYYLFSSQVKKINENKDRLETSINKLRIMNTRLSKNQLLKEEHHFTSLTMQSCHLVEKS